MKRASATTTVAGTTAPRSADGTALGFLRRATDFLRNRGVPNPRLDAEVLLADTLGVDRVGVYLNFDRPLEEREVAAYRDAVRRRGRREPLQHIRGRQEFFSRDFLVDARALVPRPETEILVEEALARLAGMEAPRVLDVGTGSGAIAVTIALERPVARVFATDASAEALELARANATRLGAAVTFACGDLVEPFASAGFDLVVANPPYVPSGEIAGLEPEVRDFDPRPALDGGADGLHSIRRLAAAAPAVLRDGGFLVLEIGAGQRAAGEEILRAAGLATAGVRRDLAGIERVVTGRTGEAAA